MPTPLRKQRQSRESTAEKLLQAAAQEFNEQGFGGTDTNRIARRAGFAPQTFYRWYRDKVDIFIKTYERWAREEFAALSRLMAASASDIDLARAIVAHHEAYLVFRRSLRLLSLENAAVRAARARSRLNQIEYVKKLGPNAVRDDAAVAAMLLQTERLADALAENEFHDMGLHRKAGEEALARLIHDLRHPG
ncbi:MAG TPA: helix-turn-helix domain-containing protein [Steroidobacteraceae bacterium]